MQSTFNIKINTKQLQLIRMQAPPINQQELETVLSWVDSFALSKPKRNLARDFSDGILLAEIMKQNFPQWVQLHNYTTANSSSAKYINWKTLNQKVFKKLNFIISRLDIEAIITVTPGAIQRVLYMIYCKLKYYENQKRSRKEFNEEDAQQSFQREINPALHYAKELSTQLVQKDQIIIQLRDTVLILEQKLKKMEQLSKLKDSKIQSLMKKIQQSF